MFEVVSEQKSWVSQCDIGIATDEEVLSIISEAPTLPYVGLDWETTSLNVEKAKLVGLCIAMSATKARYIPVGHMVGAELNVPLQSALDLLRALAKAEACKKIWYNFKYDGEVNKNAAGFELTDFEDVMLAVYLLDSNHKEFNLDAVSKRLLGTATKLSFKDLTQGKTFDYVHPEDACEYACADPILNVRLWELPQIQQAILEQRFVYALEKKVIPVIQEGEAAKCYICRETLVRLRDEVISQVDLLERRIYQAAGHEFKIGSSQVLGRLLLDLGVPIEEKTAKTKVPETKKEVLIKYKDAHPIVPLIIQWKELTTQNRNYIEKLIVAQEHFGSLVKFPFHSIGVPTGRMKAGGEGSQQIAFDKGVVNVNVQSMPDPAKAPHLPNIRSGCTANDTSKSSRDFVLVSADYSQVELRIAANLSREPTWIKTFAEDGDIHTTTAQLAYRDKSLDKEDPRRKIAKNMNFAMLYGGDEYTVSRHGNIPIERAKVLVDNFFGAARSLKAWIDNWIRMARRQKLVKTYFGRIRHLEMYYANDAPRWLKNKGDREAINDPIQGAAADIMKIAMVKIRKMVRERNWTNDVQQILWIHDEVILRVRLSMLEQVVEAVIDTMEFPIKGWPVAIKAEADVGWNWGEMVSFKKWKENPLPDKTLSISVPEEDGELEPVMEGDGDGWR